MKRATLILLALLVCTLAEARKVSGRVHSGGEALPGVIVTDGQRFTTTRRNGVFRLRVADDAAFVQVVTPTGYTADFRSGAPRFYRRADGSESFDFDLLKMQDTEDYTLISVSDPQFSNQRQFRQFCAEPLDGLVASAQEYEPVSNVAGIVLGDVCWDNLTLLEPYKEAIARAGVPFYAVIGNHDHNRSKVGDAACRADFEASFGPVDFAFFLGNDLVIGLDNILYETDKHYREGYSEAELDFVAGLLAHIPEGTRIFIAQHSPLRNWKTGKEIVNGETMLALLEDRTVEFLSGHSHIQNNLTYSATIREHNASSICGTWWDTDYCPDGTPRGYQIFSSTGGDFRWFTRSVDHPDDFQYEVFPPGASRQHPAAVLVNIWDYDEDWSVDWYQDGAPKGAMRQVEDCSPTFIRQIEAAFDGRKIPDYKQPHNNIHYFIAEPDSTARGVEIVIRGRNGEVRQELVDLSR